MIEGMPRSKKISSWLGLISRHLSVIFRRHRENPLTASIRGAHWFSRHDPINFWDAFRPDDVSTEFRLLREDGFNTIFLLIPWHAFFPANNDQIDHWYAKRLQLVLDAAHQEGLRVIGRLFYEHCASRSEEILLRKRQYEVLNNPEMIGIIRKQAKALKKLVKRYPAWGEGFVSWEDFWSCFEGPPTWAFEARHLVARSSGFSHWVNIVLGEERAREQGLECIDGTWVIPAHHTPGMASWVLFFDNVFRERVLRPCTEVFLADIGAEVRVDAYPISRENGDYDWCYFDLCNDLPGRRYVYWGPYYGQRNEGELLSAESAITGLGYLLDRFPVNTPPVIDQLNFQDTTLNFVANNARIDSAQINEFLLHCANSLQQRQAGYAIWAARDYRENWITNPSFQRGDCAWLSDTGQVAISAECVLRIMPDETISQLIIPARCAQAPGDLYPRFFVSIEFDRDYENASLELRVDKTIMPDHEQSLNKTMWTISHELVAPPVPWNHGITLSIRNTGSIPIDIDVIYFWGFTQSLGVRTHDGGAGRYLNGIRALNTKLN